MHMFTVYSLSVVHICPQLSHDQSIYLGACLLNCPIKLESSLNTSILVQLLPPVEARIGVCPQSISDIDGGIKSSTMF